jgi:ABC-type nitrate/sulfonate/bicarbonate transport system ATPase subunit
MKPDTRLQLDARSAHEANDLYAVRVCGIRKVFDELEAIRDVSLDVANGEFVSLLGPSGCGKSTLLMMIAGLLFPTSGEVILANTPVRGPRRDVGVVFQNPVLLPWRSVIDNVLLPIEFLRLPVEEYRARAIELLKMVKLEEFAGALPRQLSGGMRQRASICRALIHDPAILLMDDPPRSLDRTRSPVAVSRKREYFKCPPETIGDFAPAAPNFGARRPIANSQKPAIGGHFLGYKG